jgi:hypothetical protein
VRAMLFGMSFLTAAFLCVAPMIATTSQAEPIKTSKTILPGQKVELLNNSTARISGGRLNETGTFSCTCSGLNTHGTCTLSRGPSSIICGSTGSTCTGTCVLNSTATGVRGAGAVAR